MFALVARFSGLFREMTVGYHLGAREDLDIYYLASALPLFFASVGENAASRTVLPLFTRSHEKGSFDEAWRLAVGLFWLCVVGTTALAVVGFLFKAQIWRLVSGASGAALSGSIHLLIAFSLLVMIFQTLNGLEAGIMHSRKKFFIPAAMPVAYNLCIILLLFLGAPGHGVVALAFGVLTAEVVRVLIQVPILGRIGLSLKHVVKPDIRGACVALGHLLPVAIAAAFNSAIFVSDRIMARGLPEGSVSALGYGFRLWLLPCMLLASAVAIPLYSLFADSAARDDMKELRSWLTGGMRLMLHLGVPIALAMVFLRVPLVRVLYQRGAFDERATMMTSGAIGAYALSLLFFPGLLLLAQCYYSLGKSKVPMIAGLAGASINIILNLLFCQFWGHVGIALASGFSLAIIFIILTSGLKEPLGSFWLEVFGILGKAALGGVVMFSIMIISSIVIRLVSIPAGIWNSLSRLVFVGAAGCGSYLAMWRYLRR